MQNEVEQLKEVLIEKENTIKNLKNQVELNRLSAQNLQTKIDTISDLYETLIDKLVSELKDA